MQGNIRVFARVRPSSKEELEKNDGPVVQTIGEETLVLNYKQETNNGLVNATKSFEFDRVFDGKSTQTEVFKDVAPFVQSCVDGFNGKIRTSIVIR
jgi:hypothetical protein